MSKEHPITLAIGDGANDVSMILEAHVGIGKHIPPASTVYIFEPPWFSKTTNAGAVFAFTVKCYLLRYGCTSGLRVSSSSSIFTADLCFNRCDLCEPGQKGRVLMLTVIGK